MSEDGSERQIDMLMPDGNWYRTVDKFPDRIMLLRNMFLDIGEFIATHALNPDGHTYIPEILVRGSCVQAMCWVTEVPA